MKQKIMANNIRHFIRKEKEQPVEKPDDIGTKPIPSWLQPKNDRKNNEDN